MAEYRQLLSQLAVATAVPGAKSIFISHYLSQHTSTDRSSLLTRLHQEGHITVTDLIELVAASASDPLPMAVRPTSTVPELQPPPAPAVACVPGRHPLPQPSARDPTPPPSHPAPPHSTASQPTTTRSATVHSAAPPPAERTPPLAPASGPPTHLEQPAAAARDALHQEAPPPLPPAPPSEAYVMRATPPEPPYFGPPPSSSAARLSFVAAGSGGSEPVTTRAAARATPPDPSWPPSPLPVRRLPPNHSTFFDMIRSNPAPAPVGKADAGFHSGAAHANATRSTSSLTGLNGIRPDRDSRPPTAADRADPARIPRPATAGSRGLAAAPTERPAAGHGMGRHGMGWRVGAAPAQMPAAGAKRSSRRAADLVDTMGAHEKNASQV